MERVFRVEKIGITLDTRNLDENFFEYNQIKSDDGVGGITCLIRILELYEKYLVEKLNKELNIIMKRIQKHFDVNLGPIIKPWALINCYKQYYKSINI